MRSSGWGPLRAGWIVVLLLLLGGCGLVDDGSIGPDLAWDDALNSLAWVEPDAIHATSGINENAELAWRVALDGAVQQVSPPEPTPSCPEPALLAFSAVSDGRLIEQVACEFVAVPSFRLLLVNPATSAVTPVGSVPRGFRGAVYDDRSGSVYVSDSQVCLGLARVRPESGYDRIGLTWDGVTHTVDPTGDHCQETAVVELLAAGSQSSFLALAANVSATDDPTSRWERPRSLVRLDLPAGNARTVAAGFVRPQAIAVDQHRRVAYVSAVRDGVAGIWRVGLTDGEVSTVADGNYPLLAVSPDGTRLAVVADGKPRSISILDAP